MKGVFIIWGREGGLSGEYAKALGFRLKIIYIKKIGFSQIPAFLRYIIQSIITLFVLIKNNPKIVAVQNPPIFAPLSAWLYCAILGRGLLIDSHTAAFLDKKWAFFFPIFKFLSKRATVNTCHNYKNLEILKNWKAKNCREVPFAVPECNFSFRNSGSERKSILMVNRFAPDDDWWLVVDTAREMPDINFFITGEVNRKIKRKIKSAPSNVVFTGYLETRDFLNLMGKSDIVLSLTNRKDTKLWSIQEALALNKPFIYSDSETLNYYFKGAGISTKHNKEDLKRAIEKVFADEKNIKERIKFFARQNKENFFNKILEINNILSNN